MKRPVLIVLPDDPASNEMRHRLATVRGALKRHGIGIVQAKLVEWEMVANSGCGAEGPMSMIYLDPASQLEDAKRRRDTTFPIAILLDNQEQADALGEENHGLHLLGAVSGLHSATGVPIPFFLDEDDLLKALNIRKEAP